MSMVATRKYVYSPTPRQVVAIVNPFSGAGGGRRVLRLLRDYPWPAKISAFETQPGSLAMHHAAIDHALRIGAERLIVSGGDGTLMETLSAMREQGVSIPICMIPTGTGNIVANDLATPRRIYPAIQQAFNPGILRWWDAGLIRDRNLVFALRASTGFEAMALATMNAAAKHRWGIVAYAVPALREFLRTRPVTYRLTIDGRAPIQMEGVVAFAAVTNRISGAVNFVISRDILPDDGVLHVGVFHPRKILQNIPAMVNKAALQARDLVTVFPVHHSVAIETDTPQITQVDGELLGETPLYVETLPQSAAFITPLLPRGRRLPRAYRKRVAHLY